MTIHLPEDPERSVRQEVSCGRFASADDAVAVIVRASYRDRAARAESVPLVGSGGKPDPVLGAWRDAADEMDGVVPDAMKRRGEEPWRTTSGD